MQYFYQKHHSQDLIVFFAGWGCDYNQFTNLHDHKDVLILYDYQDLDLNFDFTQYHNIYLLAYSAGVFVATVLMPKIPNIKTAIALCGNPYLFDAKFGISPANVQVLQSINLDNYLTFRREYMVLSEEEYKQYNELQSLRSIESCQTELASLQNLYNRHKTKLTLLFDKALVADKDLLFNLQAQQEFYQDKLSVIKNAKHHIFFRFHSFEAIINTYADTVKNQNLARP